MDYLGDVTRVTHMGSVQDGLSRQVESLMVQPGPCTTVQLEGVLEGLVELWATVVAELAQYEAQAQQHRREYKVGRWPLLVEEEEGFTSSMLGRLLFCRRVEVTGLME